MEKGSPSFTRLPKDIILKCLLNFDWNSLGVASCACTELRSLVGPPAWKTMPVLGTCTAWERALTV